jgi:hypothetical protein
MITLRGTKSRFLEKEVAVGDQWVARQRRFQLENEK